MQPSAEPHSNGLSNTSVGADLTVHMVSARIGASTPRDGWSWQYGLVNICAENEAHKRLLELVAEFPCRLSESSRRPQAESAAACETEAKITQTDQRRLEHLRNYKESLRSLFSCEDYTGAAALKKTILEDAESEGLDIAAVREAMKAAYWDIKEEKLASKKRSYDEQWPAAERCLRARGAG